MEKFTTREIEIYKLLKEGKSRDSILAESKIPAGTLGFCLSQIYQKTDNIVKFRTAGHKFDELACFIRNNPTALDEMTKKTLVKKIKNKEVLSQPQLKPHNGGEKEKINRELIHQNIDREDEKKQADVIPAVIVLENLPSEVKITIYNLQQKYNEEIKKAEVKKEVLNDFAKEFMHVSDITKV